jgi:hypothetical protein
MPALPFSNSMGLAPNLMDITTWPDGSVFHQVLTACCLVAWNADVTSRLAAWHSLNFDFLRAGEAVDGECF